MLLSLPFLGGVVVVGSGCGSRCVLPSKSSGLGEQQKLGDLELWLTVR